MFTFPLMVINWSNHSREEEELWLKQKRRNAVAKTEVWIKYHWECVYCGVEQSMNYIPEKGHKQLTEKLPKST